MSRWRPLIAYILVLVAAVAALAWMQDVSAEKTDTSARKVAARAATNLRESQLTACGRGREDRMDSVRGWTAARQARLSTAENPRVPLRERLKAAAAAAVYRDVIAGFKRRIVDCSEAFPPVTP